MGAACESFVDEVAFELRKVGKDFQKMRGVGLKGR